MVLENTAKLVWKTGSESKFFDVRYFDVVNPTPKDERKGEEIISHIKKGVRGDKD